jgi:phospholipid-translocating ATPase
MQRLSPLKVTMIKDGYDDFQQHRQDKFLNNKVTKKIMKNGEIMPIPWKDVMTGNLLLLDKDDGVPADLVLLASHNEDGVAFLETAELDGETNLKIKTALKNTTEAIDFDDWENKDFSKLVKIVDGSFQDVELPNDRLPKFDGTFHSNSEKVSVSNDNVLLRGTILRNTPSAIGVVVYAGPDSKLMKNGGNARFKRTNMDLLMNRLVILIFVILVLFAFGATIGHIVSEFDIGIRFRQFNPWDMEIIKNTIKPNVPNFRWMETEDWKSLPWTPWKSGALIFWSYTILLNTLVPISLYVSVEMIRLGQSMFINWDRGMYYEKNDTPASARSTTLNEELGQVSYIFSDKTGTLTQNIMEFKKAYIGGRIYGNGSQPVDFSWNRHHNGEFSFTDQSLIDDFRKGNEHVNRFLKILALNHTVMPEYTEVDIDGSGAPASMLYQAQSPDEGALVSAARAFGFVFTNRTTDTIQVSRLDETITYELLHIADFDNDRKRMSVVVREPQTKEIIVYTKGADSTVLSNLTKSTPENIRKSTDEALTRFAEDGLRTLCLGYKKISEAEWSAWEKKYQEAATSMEERDEKISIVHEELESELILAGVTAIEDKLQDGVPETIKQILLAGIKLWVLTGDKLETAINIGYSCNLLANEMTNVFEVAEESSREVLENLNSIQKELDNGHGDYGLVVTGQALGYAISDHKNLLLDVSRKCKSVICCRVTPLQKAQVVQMIKEAEKCITLAIGDGANDVSMIKEAHLGIGTRSENKKKNLKFQNFQKFLKSQNF